MRIKQFRDAIVEDWISLIGGVAGVVSTVVGTILMALGISMPVWVAFPFGIACIIWAAFRVWRKEREEREAAESRAHPRLEILDNAEFDSESIWKIKVRNASSGELVRFGVRINRVENLQPDYHFRQSMQLKIPGASGDGMTELPPSQSQSVWICRPIWDGMRLEVFLKDRSEYLPLGTYGFVLTAYSDKGATVERTFEYNFTGQRLEAKPQPMDSRTSESSFRWSPLARCWRRVRCLFLEVACGRSRRLRLTRKPVQSQVRSGRR